MQITIHNKTDVHGKVQLTACCCAVVPAQETLKLWLDVDALQQPPLSPTHSCEITRDILYAQNYDIVLTEARQPGDFEHINKNKIGRRLEDYTLWCPDIKPDSPEPGGGPNQCRCPTALLLQSGCQCGGD